MNCVVKSAAVLTVFAITSSVSKPLPAADLAALRGSLKDTLTSHHRTAGPCYMRGDIGYSLSADPDIRLPIVNNGVYDGDSVSGISFDDAWMGEIGVGCGSGPQGFRAEIASSFRGRKDISGTSPAAGGSSLNTAVASYALMFNVYKDLGRWQRMVPYIGAGAGLSYNMVSDVYFADNPSLTNTISGKSDIAFSWSLMAGLGYQISRSAVLDVGYRYIDLGSGRSSRIAADGNANSLVTIDNITAHEFKIGLRYHLGQAAPSAITYGDMK